MVPPGAWACACATCLLAAAAASAQQTTVKLGATTTDPSCLSKLIFAVVEHKAGWQFYLLPGQTVQSAVSDPACLHQTLLALQQVRPSIDIGLCSSLLLA